MIKELWGIILVTPLIGALLLVGMYYPTQISILLIGCVILLMAIYGLELLLFD